MGDNRLFLFTIEETNGEQEYSHELYLIADDLKTADAEARRYAAAFYEDAEQHTGADGSQYWTLDGITWYIASIDLVSRLAVAPINAPGFYVPLPDGLPRKWSP